jgi:hypothetical protein
MQADTTKAPPTDGLNHGACSDQWTDQQACYVVAGNVYQALRAAARPAWERRSGGWRGPPYSQ